MAVDFSIKVGDVLPVLTATLSDASGALAINGATVRFHMDDRDTGAEIVNAVAENLDDATEANRGKVRYQWQAADTDTPGWFWGEFQVTFTGPKTLTFPSPGHLLIHVAEALA